MGIAGIRPGKMFGYFQVSPIAGERLGQIALSHQNIADLVLRGGEIVLPYGIAQTGFDKMLGDVAAVPIGGERLDQIALGGKNIADLAKRGAETGLPCDVAWINRGKLAKGLSDGVKKDSARAEVTACGEYGLDIFKQPHCDVSHDQLSAIVRNLADRAENVEHLVEAAQLTGVPGIQDRLREHARRTVELGQPQRLLACALLTPERKKPCDARRALSISSVV